MWISRAKCLVSRGMKGQLIYKVWQSWNSILFSFILWLKPNHWPMKEGRKPEYPEKPPDNKPENSRPNRDSNLHSHIDGKLGKQTCWPLHQALPHFWPTITLPILSWLIHILSDKYCRRETIFCMTIAVKILVTLSHFLNDHGRVNIAIVTLLYMTIIVQIMS